MAYSKSKRTYYSLIVNFVLEVCLRFDLQIETHQKKVLRFMVTSIYVGDIFSICCVEKQTRETSLSIESREGTVAR